MRTFSPAMNIQTRQVVWSCFKNGVQLMHNDEPQVHDSVFISAAFRDRYVHD
jgi:hypothetical protein